MASSSSEDFAGDVSASPASSRAQKLPDELSAKGRTSYRSQINADNKIVQILVKDGFTGANWEKFSEVLVLYGLAVIRKWISDGSIYEKTRKTGRFIRPTERECKVLQEDREEATALAIDTVTAALDLFKISLMQGKWKPGRGASLKTYYIGSCVLSFPGAFRSWRRESHILDPSDPADFKELEYLSDYFRERAPDHANSIADTDQIKDLLENTDEATREIIKLIAMGYSYAEIGEQMNLTERAIEGRVYRLRSAILHRHVKRD